MGVVKQPESVIDVAQKTIEFRNVQNTKVPLEVVAGHLTKDLMAKARFFTSKKFNDTDLGAGMSRTGGDISTVFRKARDS